MTQHILFVCKSCHHSSEKRPEHQPAYGTLLTTTGDIPWKHFPAVLQSASIAKIPAVE
jgi:predicted metal-binding protein